jgi:hypothetical protein
MNHPEPPTARENAISFTIAVILLIIVLLNY